MSLQELDNILKQLRSEENRWDAIIDLKVKGDPSWVDPLIEHLKDPDWIIRWCVAEKIGDLGDPKGIRPLLQTIVDRDFHVAKNAQKSLSKFGVDIVPDAVKLFAHKNAYLRKQIFTMLEELGEPIIPLLRKELENSDWIVSNRIVHLIWVLGQQNAEDVLISCLAHPFVQNNTIVLLGCLKSIPAIPHYIQIYDKKPSARRVIFHALKLIGKKESFPVIVDALFNSALKSSAEKLILKIGPAMLPFLAEKLIDNNSDKELLINLIQKLGPEKIADKLHILASQDKTIAALTKDLRKTLPKSPKKTKDNKFFGLFN